MGHSGIILGFRSLSWLLLARADPLGAVSHCQVRLARVHFGIKSRGHQRLFHLYASHMKTYL